MREQKADKLQVGKLQVGAGKLQVDKLQGKLVSLSA
jgi:hypothetical protein